MIARAQAAKVIKPGMTYTNGPGGKTDMLVEMGVMDLWVKGLIPSSGQTGKILHTRPHPGGDPLEIVAAFKLDACGHVVLVDQRALVDQGELFQEVVCLTPDGASHPCGPLHPQKDPGV